MILKVNICSFFKQKILVIVIEILVFEKVHIELKVYVLKTL